MSTPARTDRLLTAREAGKELGVSRNTVHRLIKEGRLAYVQWSAHTIRIPPEAVERLRSGDGARFYRQVQRPAGD